MRLSVKEINKKKYYGNGTNVVKKYYMDMPVKQMTSNKTLASQYGYEYSGYAKMTTARLYGYEGVYGSGIMDEEYRVWDAMVTINFRGIEYTLSLINDGVDTGFVIYGKMPDEKHIAFCPDDAYKFLLPVKNPKYVLSEKAVRFMLSITNDDEGIFYKQAKNTAMQILNEQNNSSVYHMTGRDLYEKRLVL